MKWAERITVVLTMAAVVGMMILTTDGGADTDHEVEAQEDPGLVVVTGNYF